MEFLSLCCSEMYFPRRYLIAIICFFGLMGDNMMRVSMGIAMVAIRDDTSGAYNISAKEAGIVLQAAPVALFFARIPGGILATMWNPKLLFTITTIILGISSILIPLAARAGPAMLFIVYAIGGLAQGASNPCVQILLSYWVPKEEKTTLFGIALAGINAGVAFGFAIGSAVTYWLGWPAMFYVEGVLQLTWVIWFHFSATNTPAEHPAISAEERAYILDSVGVSKRMKMDMTISSLKALPWKSMILSAPLWAISSIYVSFLYSFYMSVTVIQQYTDQILKLSILDSGLLMCAPFVMLIFTSSLSGYLSDKVIEQGVSTTTVRKWSMAIVELVQALGFAIVGYVSDVFWATAVCVFMTTAIGLIARSLIGANTLDISGPYGGLVLGVVNTIAMTGGIISTETANAFGFTERNADRSLALYNWRMIFGIAALVSVVSTVMYIIFGSGEREEWAKLPQDSEERPEDHALLNKGYTTTDDECTYNEPINPLMQSNDEMSEGEYGLAARGQPYSKLYNTNEYTDNT